jgi:hypothetical protein
MNATRHVTWSDALRALERCSAEHEKQGCTLAVSFGLCRGHSWADETTLGDALELAAELADPRLRILVSRALERQVRAPGDERLSVSDCSRVHWARRARDSWNDFLEPISGAPWPGGSGWIDLRVVLELRELGKDPATLADELGIGARSLRARAQRLAFDPQWMGIVPIL